LQEILTLIPVVALALVAENGTILLQQRRRGGEHGGLWEFPGGKVKAAESPESALVREIREELGIALDPADLAPLTFASDPAQPPAPREPYVILLYTCRKWAGAPQCLEGEAIGWFTRDALAKLAGVAGQMPPLDIPLAQALLKAI
jgi:8-oxo-dGTP diphosphatase